MSDERSFLEVLQDVHALSKKRDPRLRRVASLSSALRDVSGGNPSPVKFFACAVETLEGTIHQKHEKDSSFFEFLTTQTALVELIGLTIPHVPAAALGASVSLSSRVLRGVVRFWQSFGSEESAIFDTKDGLGGVDSILCSSCNAVSLLVGSLPLETDKNTVANLLQSTLLSLAKDSRTRVKSTATIELRGLLAMELPTFHTCIREATMRYVRRELEMSVKNKNEDEASRDLKGILEFLQPIAIHVDLTAIGAKIMELLVFLFASGDSSPRPVFLTRLKDTKKQILTINAILSTILSILESEVSGPKEKVLCTFASRIVASLLQLKPTLILRHGEVEEDLVQSGRVAFGQVILSCCDRLFEGKEIEIAPRLLPLIIGQIANLSRPSDSLLDVAVANILMPELSQLLRTQLRDLKLTEPVLYEKCCRESLGAMSIVLQHPYRRTWIVSLKPLAVLLQHMEPQDEQARRCIEMLISLRGETSEDTTFHQSIDDAISCLIQEVGIEQFWDQTRLSSLCLSAAERSADPVVKKPVSLLRLIKSAGSIGGSYDLHLSFFQNTVLPLARHFDSQSENEPKVLALWGLFSCFCRKPVDLEVSFPELAPVLVRAMNDKRYPELIMVICHGLRVLADGVSARRRAVEELTEGEEITQIHREVEVLGKLSEKIIPSLFKLIETLHGAHRCADDILVDSAASGEGKFFNIDQAPLVRAVTEAISSFAQLASSELVERLFSKVIHKLLEASQANDDLSEKVCSLLALSQALVSSDSLGLSSISLLYRSLKPLIRSDETSPKVQKRSYKLLSEILHRYPFFIQDSTQLKELLELLTSSMSTTQVSSRFTRIKCLIIIIESRALSSEFEQVRSLLIELFCVVKYLNLFLYCQELIQGLLPETLLSLKDSSGKTREGAYRLLLCMAGMQEDIGQFITSLLAAVGSTSCHMRSAAVVGLSRVVFEYSQDEVVQSLLSPILETVLALSDDQSREVIKSFVGFVRVSIVVLPPEELRPLLPDILHSLLKYHRGKDRFRSKIKIIIKKLVRLYGYETLIPMVPQSESRLLTHMRKLSEREFRRKMALRETGKPDESKFNDMMASDEDDSDGGETLFTGVSVISRTATRSQRTRKGKRSFGSKAPQPLRIRNDIDATVFDVDDLTQKSVRFTESHHEDHYAEDSMEIDGSGKLIIVDDDEKWDDSVNKTEVLNGYQNFELPEKVPNVRAGASSNKPVQRNGMRNNSQKLGSAYKAKTAGGDVKKKGQKYDPYAYVPLNGRSYSKKNRHRAIEQMSGVVERGRKRQKR
eukprot:scaffold3450_cov114-Cylindrotheca_fusiformis.AAC.13